MQFFVSFKFLLLFVVVVKGVVVSPEILELITSSGSKVVEDLFMGGFAFFAFGGLQLGAKIVELLSNVLVDGISDVGV